ncbi:MAG: protein phosphatase 2C domain-containing protein [Elusimicrobiota bacterium]
MKLEYACKTDVGKKRDHNEDSYGFYLDKDLFYVCDGMGGHAAGDYASKKVVETVTQLLEKEKAGDKSFGDMIVKEPGNVTEKGRYLSTLAMIANRLLFRIAVMYPKLRGMGTTFASVIFDEGFVNVVNVGDSRVYRLRRGQLKQLSVDHSWVEELLEDGELKEQELGHFREKNVITRAMGTGADLKVDWKADIVEEEDIYMLCTDGLCGEIEDDVIEKVMNDNSRDLDAVATELINAANNAGGSDNTTVIVIRAAGDVIKPADMKFDEMVTLFTNNEVNNLLDRFIDANYKLAAIDVPKGVVRERQKVHKHPVSIAVIAVLFIFTVLVFINKPWIERTVVSSDLKHGDILVRTDPPGAKVKLYFGDDLVEEKLSPADFLSLEEGEYRIDIEKDGYEGDMVAATSVRGQQELREIVLNAQAKIQISLGISPGFAPDEKIYINEKECKYYGKPLTVRRIGMVGKNINIERGREHSISVGEVTKTFYVGQEDDTVKVKIEGMDLLVE